MSGMVPDVLHYSVMRMPGIDTTTVKINPDVRQASGGDSISFDLPFSGELNLRELMMIGDISVSSGTQPSSTESLRLPPNNMSLIRQVRVEAGGELIDGSTMQDAGFVQTIRDTFRQHQDDKLESFVALDDGVNPDNLVNRRENRPRAYFKDFPGLFSYDTVPEVIDLSLLPKMRITIQFHNANDVLLPIDENGQYSSTVDGYNDKNFTLSEAQMIATFYNTKDSAITNLTRQTLENGSPIEILFDRYISREFGTGAHTQSGISRFDVTSESLDYILATYRPGRNNNLRKQFHFEEYDNPYKSYVEQRIIANTQRMTAAPFAQTQNNDATTAKSHSKQLSNSDNQTIQNWQFRLNGAHVPQYDADVRDSWHFLHTDKSVKMNNLSMAEFLRDSWCAFQRFNLPNTNKRVQSGLNVKGLRLGIEYQSYDRQDYNNEQDYSLFMMAKTSSTLVIGPNSQVFVRI
jgi:hypothetical protein